MHIEPGLVDGAKIALSYATASATLGYAATLALQAIRKDGVAALAVKVAILGLLLATIESGLAKLRIFQAPYLLGFASISYTATSNTLLQLNAPDHLRGRVMSIYFLLFAGTTPIGGFITGWLANRIGVSETLLIEAAICFVGVLVGIRYYVAHREQIPAAQTARLMRAPGGK